MLNSNRCAQKDRCHVRRKKVDVAAKKMETFYEAQCRDDVSNVSNVSDDRDDSDDSNESRYAKHC